MTTERRQPSRRTAVKGLARHMRLSAPWSDPAVRPSLLMQTLLAGAEGGYSPKTAQSIARLADCIAVSAIGPSALGPRSRSDGKSA
jgi:hypothetical protein